MKPFRFKLAAGAAAILLCAVVVGNTVRSQAQTREGGFGVGIPDAFVRKYAAFRAGQLASSARQSLRIRLGYVKGLSRSFNAIAGEFSLDLASGAYNVSLNGLTPSQTYGVWLVDAGEGGVEDVVIRLTSVRATSASAAATGVLNPTALKLPAGFSINRVVVAPGTDSPREPLASGSVNVFQKIFFRRLSLLNESSDSVLLNETTSAPKLFDLVPDLVAETDAELTSESASAFNFGSSLSTDASRSVRLDRLISRGATLFFEETFGGNGRTCGTCHPASNNFTIDRDFISTLPGSDPLFVAEFNPALAQLEKPQLMRSFGLVLENLDGLDNPTGKFVMRGVPHTLGLHMTMERDIDHAECPDPNDWLVRGRRARVGVLARLCRWGRDAAFHQEACACRRPGLQAADRASARRDGSLSALTRSVGRCGSLEDHVSGSECSNRPRAVHQRYRQPERRRDVWLLPRERGGAVR